MILDVQKLNWARKYSGELHFSLQPNDELVSIPMVKIASEIAVDGSYEIFDDDSLEVRGTVRYLLQGACSRCLQSAEKWVEAEWNACFVKGESDGENYSYKKNTVDLNQSVQDAVMFSMPHVLLCREDCEGIFYQPQPENQNN